MPIVSVWPARGGQRSAACRVYGGQGPIGSTIGVRLEGGWCISLRSMRPTFLGFRHSSEEGLAPIDDVVRLNGN